MILLDVAFLSLLAGLILLQLMRKIPLAEYAFYLRVPLICALILITFPLISQVFADELLGNILVYERATNLGMVVFAVLLASGMVIQTGSLVLAQAPDRFGVPRLIRPRPWWWMTAPVIATPITVTAWVLSPNAAGRVLSVLVAVAAATLVALATGTLKRKLAARGVAPGGGRLNALPGGLVAGYVSDSRGRREVVVDHLRMAANLIALIAIYGLGGMLLRPVGRIAPAMFYLLFLIMMLGFFLSGLTFFLDRFRVPVLLTTLLASFALYTLMGIDHVYRVDPVSYPEIEVGDREALVAATRKRLGGRKALVVVAASGGGIQAAGWTAQVLVGLQDQLGTEFTRSVALVSSVSGGSVGSLFYLDAIDENGVVTSALIGDVPKRAMGNGLPATSWGMAYPDFLRATGFGFAVPQWLDRGWALEHAFESRMHNPKSTMMGAWRDGVMSGRLPIPAFNTTIVETGERFVIAPLAMPIEEAALDFPSLYPGEDLRTATAARLSATFPYVTPIAKAQRTGGHPDYHLADGGYFDNFGAFTAIEWLKQVVLPENPLGLRDVFFIQINAFPKGTTKPKPMGGWQVAVIGPIEALSNVRTSTQLARSHVELQLLQNFAAAQGVRLHQFDFRFSLDPQELGIDEGEGSELAKRARDERDAIDWETYSPPLSWKLDRLEKEAIHFAWELTTASPELDRLRKLFSQAALRKSAAESRQDSEPIEQK